jgi:hypothetical protein
MVTPLKYFKQDPNRLGRGEGIYYHRGHGYYSKYSTHRDFMIQARGYGVDHIGVPRKSSYIHTTDGRIRR